MEKEAAHAAKTNQQKAMGPVASAIMSILIPIAMKTFMAPEKVFGWMHGYHINWDQRVTTWAVSAQQPSRRRDGTCLRVPRWEAKGRHVRRQAC